MNNTAGSDGETMCREAAALRQQWQKPGTVNRAKGMFEEAVSRDPDLWMGHFGLAEVILFLASETRVSSGPSVERALAALTTAVKLAPQEPAPLLKLASHYSGKDITSAEAFYRQAVSLPSRGSLSLYPEVWQASDLWTFAIRAADTGRGSTATDAFRRAMELNPSYRTSFKPSTANGQACWLKACKEWAATQKKWWQFWKSANSRSAEKSTEKPHTEVGATAKLPDRKLACVHCGKMVGNLHRDIWDISVGHCYAQCDDCFMRLRTGPNLLGTDDMLDVIRAYPEERKRNAIAN